ncbi:hypothetical protein Y1Q_0006381 [Alligator mississippiensis]|uniref:Uncharacterized protein n=1 Tax=Alligator mississippiensis TaxID=8496 RepID=A0A151NYF6_ALLMI|nr:hypothetical protein Y1Q_0006381 [Alligator mississippiensis]
MQDWTLLLDYLVTMMENQLANLQACYTQEVTHTQERAMSKQERAALEWDMDQECWAFWERLSALEEGHIAILKRMLECQEWQAAMVARAVDTAEEECQVLDTILALVVSFVPPTS